MAWNRRNYKLFISNGIQAHWHIQKYFCWE